MVKDLTMENFGDEVLSSDLPVIVDFYADWCGPCQMMKPVFESVSQGYEGKLKFMKLDTQAEEGVAIKFNIQGIPALVMVRGSEEVGRIVGYMNEDQLKAKIDELMGKI
ncbi:thioredoxin [archaeon]|jgi:thioredoxin|nr:thioredoxin [archaeon]